MDRTKTFIQHKLFWQGLLTLNLGAGWADVQTNTRLGPLWSPQRHSEVPRTVWVPGNPHARDTTLQP